MQILWRNGEHAGSITSEQREAITQYAKKFNLTEPITILSLPDGTGCVMFHSFGMWFGVETNGYLHT